jgi:hypothetical protein
MNAEQYRNHSGKLKMQMINMSRKKKKSELLYAQKFETAEEFYKVFRGIY